MLIEKYHHHRSQAIHAAKPVSCITKYQQQHNQAPKNNDQFGKQKLLRKYRKTQPIWQRIKLRAEY